MTSEMKYPLLDINLGHSGPGLVGFLLISPVAGGKGILEPVGDDASLNGQVNVEVFTAVNKLLRVHAYLFGEVAEKAVN